MYWKELAYVDPDQLRTSLQIRDRLEITHSAERGSQERGARFSRRSAELVLAASERQRHADIGLEARLLDAVYGGLLSSLEHHPQH